MQNEVQPDRVETLRWYATEANNADAQHALGNMYSIGNGVDPSPDQAFRWFQMAATQGHADAQSQLGVMHFNGW
jgi:TPR repeat protein